MQAWKQRLHRLEDGLLVILLSAMIALAGTQILLRNLLDTGFVWIDPMLRVLVLWLGLIGAMVATRNDKHIQIDALTRFFRRNTRRLIQVVAAQVSAWTCLLIAFYGFNWVWLDFADGLLSFAGIPAWILEIVIPVSFAMIGLRYLFMSCFRARFYLLHRRVAARARR